MSEVRKGRQIEKWDEVTGAVQIHETDASEQPENAGAGPSISRNPMKGIEDMVEQNDNNLDGIINNLPEKKSVAQKMATDVIEEENKKSVLEKLRDKGYDPVKVVSPHLDCHQCERS